MNNITGVTGYTSAAGYLGINGKNDKKEDVKQELKPQQNEVKQSSVAPEKVMDFAAATANYNAANINKSDSPKVIKISDWVTPEQAKRIAGFVTGFENEIAKGFNAVKMEDIDVSDEAALDIAVAMFASENF